MGLAERLLDRLIVGLLWLLGIVLAASAAASLEWRIVHDSPLFIYNGFLMAEHGWIPYRDFWDVNPPGTQLLHHLYVTVYGTSDLGFRVCDLSLLGVTIAATVAALRMIDPQVAWCSGLVWGLAYLNGGPRNALQRDGIVLGMVALGLLVTVSRKSRPAWRAAWLGLLFGAAGTLKPPAVLGLPVLLAFLVFDETGPDRARRAGRLVGAAALGFAVPVVLIFLYLWATGALSAFVEIATRYWPLYTKVSGGLATITNPLFNQWSGYRTFGRLGPWMWGTGLGIAAGFGLARLDAERRRVAGLLVALTATYLAYVGVQGKFFGYHWLPFLYFSITLASLACLPIGRVAGLLRRAPAIVLFALLAFYLQPAGTLREHFAGTPLPPPKGGRPDEIAAFIKGRLHPGETVQPLDWTGGVLHAMLLARALPATPYLCDSVFYHHVSQPYITDVRTRFLEAMHRSRPQLVIEIDGEDKPWVRGKDTTRDFNKLRRLLSARYDERVRRSGYVIYERKPGW